MKEERASCLNPPFLRETLVFNSYTFIFYVSCLFILTSRTLQFVNHVPLRIVWNGPCVCLLHPTFTTHLLLYFALVLVSFSCLGYFKVWSALISFGVHVLNFYTHHFFLTSHFLKHSLFYFK